VTAVSIQVAVRSTVAPGSYPIPIEGTSGALVKTVTLNLTVTDAPPPQAVTQTITSAPVGRAVTVTYGGVTKPAQTTQFTENWTPGGSYTLAVDSTQSGATGIRYIFQRWETPDGSPTTPAISGVAPSTPNTFTARFQTQYLLTTAASPTEGGTISAGGYQDANTEVTLTSSPAAGYRLVRYKVTDQNGSITYPTGNKVTMTGPLTVTAEFGPAATSKEYIRLNGRVIAIEQQ
jgi:hypothetical protein